MKDLFEWNYQLVLKGKKVMIKKLKTPKPFIDYSQAIDEWWSIIEFWRP